jgi:hypothetical protein
MLNEEKINRFYAETIMNNATVPQLSKVRDLFQDLDADEFYEIIRHILDDHDYESFQLFLYYIIMFRDLDNIQKYINADDFTLDMLERLVMFAFGHCSLQGYTTDRILDEIFYFLSEEKLLQLALTSKYISRDKLLLFYILTKFGTKELNIFMSKNKDVHGFLDYFLKLPDELMRSIIARNYHLFQYIMLMLAEDETVGKVSKEFYDKYSGEIEQLARLSDILRQYKKNTNLDVEKNLPFGQRDMARISFLINKIREMDDQNKAIDYFESENVFADSMEKNIIEAIINNPILQNTFRSIERNFFE